MQLGDGVGSSGAGGVEAEPAESVALVPQAAAVAVVLTAPLEEAVLGRNTPPSLGVTDKRCSRRQLRVCFASDRTHVTLTVTGMNPIQVTRRGAATSTLLLAGNSCTLNHGDVFTLFSDQFPLRVEKRGVQQSHQPSLLSPPLATPSAVPSITADTSQHPKQSHTTNAEQSQHPAQPPKAPALLPPSQSQHQQSESLSLSQSHQQSDASQQAQQPDGDRPVCKYGPKCYRKNAEHLKKYYHPPAPNADTTSQASQAPSVPPPSDKRRREEEERPSVTGEPEVRTPKASPASAEPKQCPRPPRPAVVEPPASHLMPPPSHLMPPPLMRNASTWGEGGRFPPTLAFPSFGTSTLKFDTALAVSTACRAIGDFLTAQGTKEIRLILCESNTLVRDTFLACRPRDPRFVITDYDITTLADHELNSMYIACEVTWRWKPVTPSGATAMFEKAQPFEVPVLLRSKHGIPARIGRPYLLTLDETSGLRREQGVLGIFACVAPNCGNADKPDYSADNEKAAEQLLELYRALLDAFAARC
eukprot:TRINITY_DN606_c0_g2_i1.p1 TRINITY_DN606_c0_g2~~TRINITY_DN606_c0_g2_i1.p1  ORF type:complete len:531 (+),score=105.70 TRINITY_DN606_c0_g2_i1:31-1623(+)